jgi:hypothetical protein
MPKLLVHGNQVAHRLTAKWPLVTRLLGLGLLAGNSAILKSSSLFDAPMRLIPLTPPPQAVEILLTFPVPTPSAQRRAQQESPEGAKRLWSTPPLGGVDPASTVLS